MRCVAMRTVAMSLLLLGLGLQPPPAGAVGGDDTNTATQVNATTQKCQDAIGKAAEKYAAKRAGAIRACLSSIVKCDEQADAGKALACRRNLLKPGTGKCAEGKVDLGVSLLGTGAAAHAQANSTSKAALVRELNKYIAAVDKRCFLQPADLDDPDTGLGFSPAPASAGDVADTTNSVPGGLGCLANGLVLESHPLANEIVDVVESLHDTCIDGSLLGGACTNDGDCAGGTCGKLAQAFRDGSIKECAGVGDVFLATGQTSCWDGVGTPIACTGTGHDGEVQAGASLDYVDNGDGTVTDVNTGLMWEKLSDDGGIHDKDDTYTWADAFAVKIATLNGGSFAGYTDWRLPNRREIESILNLENTFPSASSAFDSGCVAACTVITCSCTVADLYWSSSTNANDPIRAWTIGFGNGNANSFPKVDTYYVRAVRGGL